MSKFYMWSICAIAAFCVLLAGVSAQLYARSSLANDALCTLREDLTLRVKNSQDFLDSHPQGFAGLNAQSIQQSIDNQTRTILALSNLDCN